MHNTGVPGSLYFSVVEECVEQFTEEIGMNSVVASSSDDSSFRSAARMILPGAHPFGNPCGEVDSFETRQTRVGLRA